jgi:HEAT repeat protein
MANWERIVADMHNVDDIDCAGAACRALDAASDETRLPQLHQLLTGGKYFFVREAAAFPIARLEGLRALPQLLYALELGEEEGHDNDGLQTVVTGLVKSDPMQAAPRLRRMLRGRSERQRAQAAWLWGYAAKALTPEPLFPLLTDPSPRLRLAAVGSLGSFKGRDDVFGKLVRALDDPDIRVKCSAISALGYYRDPRALAPLRAMLVGAHATVQSSVRFALRALGKVQ